MRRFPNGKSKIFKTFDFHAHPIVKASVQEAPPTPVEMSQLNEPADVTPRVPATPKPNFLTHPAIEEERPKLKRNFFHNWVDSSDWRPKDIAMMTPEQRYGYEKRLLRERPKYVPMKPEVVARLSPEDKKEYEEFLQEVPKRYGLRSRPY